MEQPTSTKDLRTEASDAFPIVGIGASAGGLEPLRKLFSELPDDTGMAFVVIQHLDPTRASLLSDLLTSDVQMPVVEVATSLRAEPNRVYVIPPDADLTVHEGVIEPVPRTQTRKIHLPIDGFFRALAADVSQRAIGVILSGAASDGTDGLRAIKAAGGFTLVQEPSSAQFRSMPESVIAADVFDFRGLPEEIAAELVRLSREPYLAVKGPFDLESDEPSLVEHRALQQIFKEIRGAAHLDFGGYKRPTIQRRILRRMALRRMASLVQYADSLHDDSVEVKALARDILIHVTSFFRDRAAFDSLRQNVFPALLAAKQGDPHFRIWVPGCASGQEAYTIAIVLTEFLAEQHSKASIKVFGTDLSERAIEIARQGIYAESDLDGLDETRLSNFFERVEGGYRIGKQIRELCVFVRHDLTQDPPFAKLDLVSCRNVLIYFDLDLQRRIVPLLHHCLNNPGYLFLGSSEGLREFQSNFKPVDKVQRIYAKIGDSPHMEYPRSLGREAESRLVDFRAAQLPRPAQDARRQADHLLLARYAPAGVVVNGSFDVVEFRGRIGSYLQPPPGQPQTNVLRMAREGLAEPLRESLEAAKVQLVPVRREGVLVVDDEQTRQVTLEVTPLNVVSAAAEPFFLVIFEAPAQHPRAERSLSKEQQTPTGTERDETVTRLRTELLASREYLQAIVGEHQDTVEALEVTNEELIAANEELQSTNEELQSAKEELQSANEELITLNEELSHRNLELDTAANDLLNVLDSVQVPVIMVDQDLRVRRFTPSAREISSLLPADVGRPIDDVKFKVNIDDLAARIRASVETISSMDYEVEARNGRWYRLNIRPYRTTDRRLDGAVLSFLDIDVLKHSLLDAERARDYAQNVVDTVPIALVVLDRDMRVVSANSRFCKMLMTSSGSANTTTIFEFADRALDVPPLRQAIERSLAQHSPFVEVEFQCALPAMGGRNLVVAGSPVRGATGESMLLIAFDDVTEQRLLEASEKQSRMDAEQANRDKDVFLATLSHELRTPLSTIMVSSQLLQRLPSEDERVRRASSAIERAVRSQARLVDDLLDVSRIISGKLMLALQAVDLLDVVQSSINAVHAQVEAKRLELRLDVCKPLGVVNGDPTRLQQVVTNLLNNSIKFTLAGGKINVRLETVASEALITISDTGIGIRPDLIPHLFRRFMQAESGRTYSRGGLGLGLAIVHHLVAVHGGTITAKSPGEGLGSTFIVTLPLAAHGAVTRSNGRRSVPSIAGLRVLLVEDDDDIREAYATMLQVEGAEVEAVCSAADGLAVLAKFLPHVILCDIAMVGDDGYAFVRKLRSGTVCNDVPAAAFTAMAGEETRIRSLEAGFQSSLIKPIGAAELTVAVAALARTSQDAPSSVPRPANVEC